VTERVTESYRGHDQIQPRIPTEMAPIPISTSSTTMPPSVPRSAMGERIESGFLPPVEAPRRPNNRDLDMALVQEANNRASKATGSRVKGKITTST
jgi:hypothetical protein